MPWHDVVQGEDIVTIAREYNIGNWELIWDHPENARLRAERDSPYVLAPDDRVFVPDYRGEVVVLQSGSRHSLVYAGPTQRHVRLALCDGRRNPFRETRYALTVGNETVEGSTDDAGALDVIVPVDASSADLTLFPRDGNDDLKYEWRLRLGYLDPISSVSGVKARLRNLGYHIGEVNDTADEELNNAVTLFRAQYSLPVSSEIDDDFRTQLRLAHGGS